MTFERYLADCAATGTDCAWLAAAVLIREGGDGEAAIAALAEFSAKVPPEGDELDAAGIAAQAIRRALDSGVVPRASA